MNFPADVETLSGKWLSFSGSRFDGQKKENIHFSFLENIFLFLFQSDNYFDPIKSCGRCGLLKRTLLTSVLDLRDVDLLQIMDLSWILTSIKTFLHSFFLSLFFFFFSFLLCINFEGQKHIRPFHSSCESKAAWNSQNLFELVCYGKTL